jgi:2-dehydro-3-deoxygluconokinase
VILLQRSINGGRVPTSIDSSDLAGPAPRVVCLGELLFRLGAPGRELLLQSPRLEVHFGGAEANVAIALARFGHPVAMISVVPDNALGNAARAELRRHGVDVAQVRNGPGRMGLYFLETGAMQRPSEVLYDRAGSAFALVDPQQFDWPSILADSTLLHLSGVTPALGSGPAGLAMNAARSARDAGIDVVFDGNFRQKLWQASGADPRPILHALFDCATTIFADQRDIALVLGTDTEGLAPDAAFAAAAQAAFAAFPRLQRLASTQRSASAADRQRLAASLATRERMLTLDAIALDGVVDRIGGGDAFAAGVLHGLLDGRGVDAALRFGLGCACLKHSVPGDSIRFGADAVEAFLRDERVDVRR